MVLTCAVSTGQHTSTSIARCQSHKKAARDNYIFRESGTLSSGTRPSPKLPAGGSSSGSTSSTPSSRCFHQSSSSTTHHHQSSVMISFAFFYHPGIHSPPVRLLPLPALLLVTNFFSQPLSVGGGGEDLHFSTLPSATLPPLPIVITLVPLFPQH